MKTKEWLFLLCLLAMLVLAEVPVLSETTAATYDLSLWSVDGGEISGITSSNYSLSGSVGQPDVGALIMDNYVLIGGFWTGILEYRYNFLPVVIK